MNIKIKSNYWDKERFDERIKWYNEDIKMCRRAKELYGDCLDIDLTQTNLIKSLIASKRFHIITYKTKRKKAIREIPLLF